MIANLYKGFGFSRKQFRAICKTSCVFTEAQLFDQFDSQGLLSSWAKRWLKASCQSFDNAIAIAQQ